MNTNPNELVSQTEHTEVVHEAEDGLIEIGAVSETKGGWVGTKPDTGNGLQVT